MIYGICKSLHIEDDRVCKGVVQEFKSEFFNVLNNVTLSSDEICGIVVGRHCASSKDLYDDWNVTFPKIPKPPVIPPKPPKIMKIVPNSCTCDYSLTIHLSHFSCSFTNLLSLVPFVPFRSSLLSFACSSSLVPSRVLLSLRAPLSVPFRVLLSLVPSRAPLSCPSPCSSLLSLCVLLSLVPFLLSVLLSLVPLSRAPLSCPFSRAPLSCPFACSSLLCPFTCSSLLSLLSCPFVLLSCPFSRAPLSCPLCPCSSLLSFSGAPLSCPFRPCSSLLSLSGAAPLLSLVPPLSCPFSLSLCPFRRAPLSCPFRRAPLSCPFRRAPLSCPFRRAPLSCPFRRAPLSCPFRRAPLSLSLSLMHFCQPSFPP
ncbi:unnamed protein product [Acanthosepion pharaonis]|uniref:Uncharacterized protein n=1 Tax=Acanthosepion pharaonis TaxID=158019 RepID=A0A812EUJ0_ACAPH|nr:unnamed protein product [Sepia pharaonis]